MGVLTPDPRKPAVKNPYADDPLGVKPPLTDERLAEIRKNVQAHRDVWRREMLELLDHIDWLQAEVERVKELADKADALRGRMLDAQKRVYERDQEIGRLKARNYDYWKAEHRSAALEEAAKVAERVPWPEFSTPSTGYMVGHEAARYAAGNAIRVLKKSP